MKCPGCGCNYMDDEKICPMCEMPNNAFARAAHKLRRKKHEEEYNDCATTTCAHPDDNSKEARRRRVEQQRAERLSRRAHPPRPAQTTARPATSSVFKSKKNQQSDGKRIIKIVLGIIIGVNFVLPLIFGILSEILWYLF